MINARDRQALIDVLSVLDRALGYPIDSEETFLARDYLQDAVIRCLEIVGEATKRLSPELRLLHPSVPWRAMAGMRDVLIHSYDQVNWKRSGWPIGAFRRSVAMSIRS